MLLWRDDGGTAGQRTCYNSYLLTNADNVRRPSSLTITCDFVGLLDTPYTLHTPYPHPTHPTPLRMLRERQELQEISFKGKQSNVLDAFVARVRKIINEFSFLAKSNTTCMPYIAFRIPHTKVPDHFVHGFFFYFLQV